MSENTASVSRAPLRLRMLVVAVVAAALPVAVGAAVVIASSPPSRGKVIEVLLFFLIALAADLKPVPIDETGERKVSLASVFLLASMILFGWEYATLAALLVAVVSQIAEESDSLRAVFNTAVYSLAAAASAIPVFVLGLDPLGHASPNYDELALLAFCGGACYVFVNVGLVSVAVTTVRPTSVRVLLMDNLHHYGPAYVIKAFMATLAALLWTVEPRLELLLAGPLLTLALYQRYASRSVAAEHRAQTDGLTGLYNHRSFQQDLGDALESAAESDGPVALCLIDIDNFKSINDRFGHPIGDDVLKLLAEVLRTESTTGVTPYRMGGEEFALLFPGWHETAAAELVEAVHRRLVATSFPHGEPLTISAGISAYPHFAADRDELLRTADGALYWSKNHGKNRSCIYSPSVVDVVSPEELEANAARQARLRAVEGLIKVVDAKDAYGGAHSQSVARIAEGIARAMGLDEATVEKVRIAGLLHDVGKIAMPRRVLQKPTELSEDEAALVREHSALGARLLDGLGLEPVEEWIRHHHERWDGAGYPDGLAGEEIPFGARILLVADAFDAITTERVYRGAQDDAAALAELRRNAWQQFDARVVSALETYLAEAEGGFVQPVAQAAR